MYTIKAMNSANANGKTKIFADGEITLGEVIEDADFAAVLTGSGTYNLNGDTMTTADFSKTLDELGLKETGTNYLMSVKAANGAC